MRCQKLCIAALVSVLLISAVSVTAFAEKNETDVVESSEGIWIEELVLKEYDTYAEFKQEIKNGELVKELKSGTFPVKLTNEVYTLQSKDSVSNLKFSYKNSQISRSLKSDSEDRENKTTKESLNLKNIICTPDHVSFLYSDNVGFTYYPDYKSPVSGLHDTLQMYERAKEYAVKTNVIDGHKVYMTYDTFDKDDAKEYIYTWEENEHLFRIYVPAEKDINFGFALCRLNKRNIFRFESEDPDLVTEYDVYDFETGEEYTVPAIIFHQEGEEVTIPSKLPQKIGNDSFYRERTLRKTELLSEIGERI